MLTVFFSQEGVIHHEQHQMVKLLTWNTMSKFSIGCVMQRSKSDLHHRSEVTSSCTHPCHLVQNFWAKHQTLQLSQPYLLDMAPCNYFLFPKDENVLKGNRFQDTEIK
jgi:hypothetical protein